ncbi:MAG: DUF2637 domain-containing protein [Actinophytocola sp.]|uniref:DUF2637 domain-containing protein n=1 Tax=Actinophytocola sp. TaxID=1872138 RepID=UPI003C734FB4
MRNLLAVFRISQNARLRLMAFITIADTGLISYVSTRNLAERWGFGSLSWLYPLCLDAVAAVGMDLWMSGSPAKRAAARLTLAAVGLSLAANIADWLYVGIGAAALGAVPPLMLAALLLTMHVHSAGTAARDERASTEADAVPPPVEQDQRTTSVPEPSLFRGRSSEELEPLPRTRPAQGPSPERPDEELIATIRDRESHGDQMSKRRVMGEFGVGNDRALRLLQNARRNGHQLVLPEPGPTA